MTIVPRAAYVAGGLLVTTIAGLAILDARYGSGVAPAQFLIFAYALGVAAWFVLRFLRVRLRPETVAGMAVIGAGMWIAMGAEFNWVFWFVAVPASGALAASLPPARSRTRSVRSANL